MNRLYSRPHSMPFISERLVEDVSVIQDEPVPEEPVEQASTPDHA